MDDSEIATLFSYSEDELRTHPHLRTYMERMSPALPEILRDPKLRRRFMLAGLYLTYKRCVKSGLTMSTNLDKSADADEDIHSRRLRVFFEETHFEIQDEFHYLKSIAMNPIKVLFRGPGRHLYRFVTTGL